MHRCLLREKSDALQDAPRSLSRRRSRICTLETVPAAFDRPASGLLCEFEHLTHWSPRAWFAATAPRGLVPHGSKHCCLEGLAAGKAPSTSSSCGYVAQASRGILPTRKCSLLVTQLSAMQYLRKEQLRRRFSVHSRVVHKQLSSRFGSHVA